jgi:hypothetical protein
MFLTRKKAAEHEWDVEWLLMAVILLAFVWAVSAIH